MPDHCHILLNVAPPNTISKIMNVFKSGLIFDLGVSKLWQPRFHIRIPEKDIRKMLSYIHMNPVRAGLVEDQQSYLWSSACGKWDITHIPWS